MLGFGLGLVGGGESLVGGVVGGVVLVVVGGVLGAVEVLRLGGGLGRVVGLGNPDGELVAVALDPGAVEADPGRLARSSDVLTDGVASSPRVTRPPPPLCSATMATMVRTSTASRAINAGDRARFGARRRRGASGPRS